MGSVLHGCARTTPRVRAELQAAQASTRALAARYGLNPKTVAKWRRRTTTADLSMGPRVRRSAGLGPAEEALVGEFRRRTLLPLDDVLGRLRATVPQLSRSACLQRHGISRLPRSSGNASTRGRFTETAIGYGHIDVAELRSAEGKENRMIISRSVRRIAAAIAALTAASTGTARAQAPACATADPTATSLVSEVRKHFADPGIDSTAAKQAGFPFAKDTAVQLVTTDSVCALAVQAYNATAQATNTPQAITQAYVVRVGSTGYVVMGWPEGPTVNEWHLNYVYNAAWSYKYNWSW